VRSKDHGVSQVLVGLHRVGIVGLQHALRLAESSETTEREAIVDLMIASLEAENYIPDQQRAEYRVALWREFLRHRGEDLSEFYSTVDVTVRGDCDDTRERFVAMTQEVLSEFELRARVDFAPPGVDGPNPQLWIDEHAVVKGMIGREAFTTQVRRTLSDW